MNKLEGQGEGNNNENMEQNAPNINETETPEDQQIEAELDNEPTNVDDITEPLEVETNGENEPEVLPITSEEIDTAEKEMKENQFNSDKYIQEVDKGFVDFSKRILSKLKLDKETREKMAGVAEKFVGELYEDFKHIMKDIDEAYAKGQNEEAVQMGVKFTEEAKRKAVEYFGDKVDEWVKQNDSLFEEAEKEKNQEKKEKLLKIALEAVDFIPFVGDVKMISEGAVGRTAQGKKLQGFRRFMHTAEGIGFLALNTASLGQGGTYLKGLKSAKIFTRSAAVLRKIGVGRKVYKPVYKAGIFLAKHPNSAKIVDKGFIYIKARRKFRTEKTGEKAADKFYEMADRLSEKEQSEAA